LEVAEEKRERRTLERRVRDWQAFMEICSSSQRIKRNSSGKLSPCSIKYRHENGILVAAKSSITSFYNASKFKAFTCTSKLYSNNKKFV
jgi:hypothetical protein